MSQTQVTQVDNLVDRLLDNYKKFIIEERPSPFELPEQRNEKNILQLKEFFRMKSLQTHLERAIPAIIEKCKAELPAEEWCVMKNELKAAQKELNESIQKDELFTSLMQIFKFSEPTLRHFEWVGTETFFNGDFYLSSSIFAFLTVLDPMVERYWIRCGISYQENKNYTEALGCFAAAIYLNEENPLSYFFSADCYRKIFDLASAKQHLEEGKNILKKSENKDPELLEMAKYLEEKLAF